MSMMKVVILAGGFGTRLSEETDVLPKPMIEIGGKPILWHIMKIYSHYGFNDFIICLGYKGYCIKEYFAHYYLHCSDITFDFSSNNEMTIHEHKAEPWKVTLVDTGLETMTGGRVKKIQRFIGNNPFMLTYGDGVSDINIVNLANFHKRKKKIATLTSFNLSEQFGVIDSNNKDEIISFQEKPRNKNSWVNIGFFVFEPEIFNYISDEQTVLEREPLKALVEEKQLISYKHYGFWKAMDALRDKRELEKLWSSGEPPWKIWKD